MTTEPVATADQLIDLPMNLTDAQRKLLDQEPEAAAGVRAAADTAAAVESESIIRGDVAILQIARIESEEEAALVGDLFTNASDAIKTIAAGPGGDVPGFESICADARRTWMNMRSLWDAVKEKPEAIRTKARGLLREWGTREQRRIDAEIEAARQAAEDLAAATLIAEAVELVDAGKDEAADILLETPTAAIAVPTVTETKAAVAGVTFVDEYLIEVTDESKIPDAYVIRTIDTRAILALAKTMKDPARTMLAVPGIRVWTEKRPDRKGRR